VLGFEVFSKVEYDDVIIIKNSQGVEINLITNGDDANENKNILMDVEKNPAYTHVADTIERFEQRCSRISQGPVTFGDGHVSVFIRDPDRNVMISERAAAHDPDRSQTVSRLVAQLFKFKNQRITEVLLVFDGGVAPTGDPL